jgi:hypothetical protein
MAASGDGALPGELILFETVQGIPVSRISLGAMRE